MRPSFARLWRAALLGLVLHAAMPAAAQPHSPAVEARPEELVEGWLLRDCGLSETESRRNLQKHPDRVVGLLVAAFREGPPAALVLEVESAARARFRLRRTALRDRDRLGLSHLDVGRVADLSEDDYVARERTRFPLRYRTQAFRGVLAVRPHLAPALLREVSGDANSSLHEIAQRLLEQATPD